MTERPGLLVAAGRSGTMQDDPGRTMPARFLKEATGLILLSGTSCYSSTLVDQGGCFKPPTNRETDKGRNTNTNRETDKGRNTNVN